MKNGIIVSSARLITGIVEEPPVAILNRQSRAEWQNTFDWLHILPVRVTISQYKSYSANDCHILPI